MVNIIFNFLCRISQSKESGLFEDWIDTTIRLIEVNSRLFSKILCESEPGEKFKYELLTIYQTRDVFYLVVIGSWISTLCLLIEITLNTYWNRAQNISTYLTMLISKFISMLILFFKKHKTKKIKTQRRKHTIDSKIKRPVPSQYWYI